ncbi:unnamed protein product, partial [Didymodactylos carnosus]
MCSITEVKPRRVIVSCKQFFNDNELLSSKIATTSQTYFKVSSLPQRSTTKSSNRHQYSSYQNYNSNNSTTSYYSSYNNNNPSYYSRRNNNFNFSQNHKTRYQSVQKHQSHSRLYDITNNQTVHYSSNRNLQNDTTSYHNSDILSNNLTDISENKKQNKTIIKTLGTSLNPLSPAFHSKRQHPLIIENSTSEQKPHYQSETSDYCTDPEQQHHHVSNRQSELPPSPVLRSFDPNQRSIKKSSIPTAFTFDDLEAKKLACTSFSSSSSSGYQEEHGLGSTTSCRRVSSSSSTSSCSSSSPSETYRNSSKYSTSKSYKTNTKQRTHSELILTSSSMDESNSDDVIMDENQQQQQPYQNQCLCEKENYSKKKQQLQQRKSTTQRRSISSVTCEKCELKRKLTSRPSKYLHTKQRRRIRQDDSISIKNMNYSINQSPSEEENEKYQQNQSISSSIFNQKMSKNSSPFSSSSSSMCYANKKIVINNDPFNGTVNNNDYFYADLTGQDILLSIDYHDCLCLSTKLSETISSSYLPSTLSTQQYSQPIQSAFFTATQATPIFLTSSALSTCHCLQHKTQQLLTKTFVPCYSFPMSTISYLPFSSSNILIPSTNHCKCSNSTDCTNSIIMLNNDDIIRNTSHNHYNNTKHYYTTYQNHTTNQNNAKLYTPTQTLFHYDLTTTSSPSICMDNTSVLENVETTHDRQKQQYCLRWFTPIIETEFLQPPPTRSWLRLSSPNVTQPTAIFTVMNYNILCDKYATRNAYGYCPSWALKWDYRRKQILEELKNYAADIIALQEIEMDQYHAFFLPELKSLGYDGVFSPKSRARTMCESDRRFVDGCAIFYRKTKFRLVENYLVEFNQLAMSAANGLSSHDMLNRVMTKDNIGLVALLETNEEIYSHTFSSGIVPADHKQLLFVCTAHIHWDPEFCDVKLVQTLMLLSELKTIIEDATKTHRPSITNHTSIDCNSIPLVLCGDFNSLPDSGVIELMRNGHIPLSHADFKELQYESCLQKISRQEGSSDLVHHFKLQSAYETNIMPYTNYTYDFKGIIDYVFYSKQLMRVLGVLGPLDPEWIRSNKIIG